MNFSVYIETARQAAAATVKITIGSTSYSRKWRMKVSFIDCFSPMRAPTDCQQYFTGISGNALSHNWNGFHLFNKNQESTTCFRQEVGYCSIGNLKCQLLELSFYDLSPVDFTVNNPGNKPDYFELDGNQRPGGRRTAGSCNENFINIQTIPENDVDNTNYFCSNQLSAMGGDTISSRIRCTVSNLIFSSIRC